MSGSGSVIDALVVTLGLESKGFNDGITKAMGSLTGFATKVAGLAIGFEGLEAGIRYFTQLHEKMADLEFSAQNLGVLGTSLKKLGEMAQLFGGSFDDAKSSVEGLQGAIFNLRFKGQMSESLMMMQRFGVRYTDDHGHTLGEVDIARNAARAIDAQAQRTPGGMEVGQRRQLALSFGLNGGLANAAAAGVANFEEVWRQAQKDNKGLPEKMLRDNLQAYKDIDIRGRTQREIDRMPLLDALIPAFEKLNNDLTDLTAKAVPYLTRGLKDLEKTILGAAEVGKKVAATVAKAYDSTLLPPTRPGEKPVSALAPMAGGYRLGETLRDRFDEWMSKFTGLPISAVPRPAGPSSEWDNPTSSGIAHGHIRRPHAVIPPLAPVTPLAPRPPSSAAAGSKPTAANIDNSVQIDQVTIHTRATDANGIAGDIRSSLQRKLLAAGAERGLA